MWVSKSRDHVQPKGRVPCHLTVIEAYNRGAAARLPLAYQVLLTSEMCKEWQERNQLINTCILNLTHIWAQHSAEYVKEF